MLAALGGGKAALKPAGGGLGALFGGGGAAGQKKGVSVVAARRKLDARLAAERAEVDKLGIIDPELSAVVVLLAKVRPTSYDA